MPTGMWPFGVVGRKLTGVMKFQQKVMSACSKTLWMWRNHVFSETSVKFYQTACLGGSWTSVFGIVARLWAGRSGVRIPVGARDFFSSPKRPEPRSHWVPGVKRPGREANRLMPGLIMYGAIPLLPLCGVNKENLTFTFPAECLTSRKSVLRMRYLEIFVAALICRHIFM
jgi:hypothetical protein